MEVYLKKIKKQIPSNEDQNKLIFYSFKLMILGEGLVFFALLIYGIWRIRKSIQKDIQLSLRQTNFILSITHELKTPIASIKILVQTLLKHELTVDKRNELLNKALEENKRLELMIENILQAANLENKSLKPEKSLFIFSVFCQEIIDRYHKIHGKSFIEFQLVEDAELNADRFMMEVIIINLIENAIKYAGIDSSIILYCHQDGNSFVFGVKDSGPGIQLAQREQIFNKFYRIGNEETRTQKERARPQRENQRRPFKNRRENDCSQNLGKGLACNHLYGTSD